MRRLPILVLAFAAALAAVCVRQPASAQYFGGAAIDNIRCESSEGVAEHVHAHLQLIDRGRSVTVPSNVGIPLGLGCLYWVHTHSNDGVIHIEAPVRRAFTLGDFFDIWGQTLTRGQAGPLAAPKGAQLRITVNGRAYSGDPARIVLRDHDEIVFQAGPPFLRARNYDWRRL